MKYYKADTAGNMTPFEGDGQIRYDETLTENKTLTVNDSGKIFLIGTDGLTITLPSTVAGLEYTFKNIGADGAVGITVEPAAADMIMGSFDNAGLKITASGTNDKGFVNTKATANNGDSLTILGDGDDGWYISDGCGIWTEEDQTASKVLIDPKNSTTEVGEIKIGSLSSAETLADDPGSAVIPMILSVAHSAGAGDCDDYVGFYNKLNVTGDGDSGLTGVCSAQRAYVGLTGGENDSVIKECYAHQPWARHQGEGAITAMSASSQKIDVGSDNFTASTVNGTHVHVDGSATVTGLFEGSVVEVYPDVTSLDSCFHAKVNTGATVGVAFKVTGSPTAEFLTSSGAKLFSGSAANAAAVYAAVGTDGATGSIYLSTAGAMYFQVANAGAESDWEAVTTS